MDQDNTPIRNFMHTRFLILFTLLLVSAATTSADTALNSSWPQWRGPNRDGHFTGPVWPEKLNTNHLKRIWRVDFGPSYSGPIVAGDRVFTTESKDKKFEVVTAFDRQTGKQLWRT
ncbi:MAG: outer membrane protein assembly factor BamB precursor, partial [Pseudomonadota bacterium]